MLKSICAWCDKELGEKPGGDGISHGICPSCSKDLLSDYFQSKKKGGDIPESRVQTGAHYDITSYQPRSRDLKKTLSPDSRSRDHFINLFKSYKGSGSMERIRPEEDQNENGNEFT